MTFYNYIENAKGKVADIVNDWTQEGANTKAYVNDNLDGARREYMQLVTENAKLRELVRHLYEYRQLYLKTGIYPTDHGVTERRMRELGVEVNK